MLKKYNDKVIRQLGNPSLFLSHSFLSSLNYSSFRDSLLHHANRASSLPGFRCLFGTELRLQERWKIVTGTKYSLLLLYFLGPPCIIIGRPLWLDMFLPVRSWIPSPIKVAARYIVSINDLERKEAWFDIGYDFTTIVGHFYTNISKRMMEMDYNLTRIKRAISLQSNLIETNQKLA